MTPRYAIAWLLVVATFSGCGKEYLDTSYGEQRLAGQAGSVNGTDVLTSMFKDAGHDVHTRRTLVTDEMTAADIVVWFPDDYKAPRKEVCDWFDQWLVENPGRTLIFVGRDFSAAPQYWDFHYGRKPVTEAQDKVPQGQASQDSSVSTSTNKTDDEKTAKADEDRSAEDQDIPDAEESSECRWFTYEPGEMLTVRELSGPWADGINASKARIEIGTRLVPNGEFETLLDSEVGPIVTRIKPPYSESSQLILVENGSFLLNLALINHEHRMLAGELVAAAGESGSVVFLESGPGGPAIDPPPSDSSLWTLFQGWPLGAILLQLAVAGIIFGFARWPIFGRPKQPASAAITDFSDHVAAVGELLAKTRDVNLTNPLDAAPSTAHQIKTDPRGSSSMFR